MGVRVGCKTAPSLWCEQQEWCGCQFLGWGGQGVGGVGLTRLTSPHYL